MEKVMSRKVKTREEWTWGDIKGRSIKDVEYSEAGGSLVILFRDGLRAEFNATSTGRLDAFIITTQMKPQEVKMPLPGEAKFSPFSV
jgi:hypothetical protein